MRCTALLLLALCSCGGNAFSTASQPDLVSLDAGGDDAGRSSDAPAPEANADDAAPAVDASHDAPPPPVADAGAVDAGPDVLEDAGPDVVDAAPDVDPTNPCDAGSCPLADGGHCDNGDYFGCFADPQYQAICTAYDWMTAPFICTDPTAGGNTNPPGCGHPPNEPGLWCCVPFCPTPAP